MRVTAKGRITIPKHFRDAAGLGPGSEVSFGLEGRKIVITPVGKGVTEDRRAKLLAAAARAGEGETVVLSYVEWPDRAARDAGMEKVTNDPRMLFQGGPPTFDGRRLIAGGFVPMLMASGEAER